MNAADRLYHPDLGDAICNDNPAEKLHRLATTAIPIVGENMNHLGLEVGGRPVPWF